MSVAAAEIAGPAPSPASASLFQRIALAGAVAHAALLPITHAGMQIAVAVALVGVIGLAAQGRARWPRGPLVWAALLLAGAAALSVPIAAAFGSPPVEWRKCTSWWGVLSPVVLLPAFQLGRWRDHADAPRRNVVLALVAWSIGALVTSLVAWLQYGFGFDPVYALGMRSAPVIAEAPLTPGHYAAVGFFRWYTALAHTLTPPLLVAFAVSLHAPLSRWKRALLLVAALAASSAVVLTVSRAAWAALLLGLGLAIVLVGQSWRRAAVLAIVACTAMAAHPGVRARVANLRSPEAISDRALIWSVCAEMVKDRPLTGWGWGNVPARSEPYWQRIAPEFPLHAWCHNSFFTAWAEGGPLLAAALLAYWVLVAVACWRARGGDRFSRAAAAGGLAVLAATFLNGMLHDIFRSGESTLALGFALTAAIVLARGSTSAPELSGAAAEGSAGRPRGSPGRTPPT